MAQSLNKYALLLALLWSGLVSNAQLDKAGNKDYQDKEEFKRFNNRSNLVSSWQIQNLKFGAIVVRLQNDKKQIDACKKVGDIKSANRIKAEAQYHNKIIIRSVMNELNFCKVYFMYAQNSDSLLNGKRQDIFLDSNLQISPLITMTENFYLIAEEYYVNNSSIGFVREDTARFQVDKGNGYRYTTLVLKNKYGHQLKPPFPFHGKTYFSLIGVRLKVKEKIITESGKEEIVTLKPERGNTFKMYRKSIEDLNISLDNFYQNHQGTQISDPSIKDFLY